MLLAISVHTVKFMNIYLKYNGTANYTILLFQVPVGGQSVHYVSYKRNTFYPMKLPKYTLPKVRLLERMQFLVSCAHAEEQAAEQVHH